MYSNLHHEQDTIKGKFFSGVLIGIMVRVFATCPDDLGSISGRVIQKIQKWFLMPPCETLSIVRYRLRVSGAPSPAPQCSSY